MKKRNWWKNFIFCGLLVMIGLFISIKIDGNFWWIGASSGGFLGYLLCDIKGLATAFSRSWKMARGWKIDGRKVYRVTKSLVIIYISAFGFIINFFVVVSLILVAGRSAEFDIISIDYFWSFLVITSLLSVLVSLFTFTTADDSFTKDDSSIEQALKVSKKIRKLNFFRVYFYLLPKGVWWCAKKTPYVILITLKGFYYGGIFAAKFLKYFFILVHSEYRMTYATYVFIGVAIGYLTGCGVAIGGVIGGILGTIGLNIVPKYLPKSKLAPANGHE